MANTDTFYTLKGYQRNENAALTTAMEDYLEMICRILEEKEDVRVQDLSRMLHVKPSSVTKMVQQLNQLGYLHAERYGHITLTEQGKRAGDYLLYRHDVIHGFLCALNHSQNELEQVEKIEHFLERTTVENMEKLTRHLENEAGNFG